MRRFATAFSISIITFSLALGALAQNRGPRGGRPSPEQIIQRMDRDGDGKISRREFRGPPERFDVLDADGDGLVTASEFRTIFNNLGRRQENAAAKYPIIDTHVHIHPRAGSQGNFYNDWEGATKNAVAGMDKYGVKTSIIMSPPLPTDRGGEWDVEKLFAIAKKYPGRFAVMGGGATLNPLIDGAPKTGKVSGALRRKFEKTAEDLLKRGVAGFGEITAMHFSFFDHHPYEETPPDHPLYLLLADIAARNDVPIDFHMEAVPRTAPVPEHLHKRSRSNPNEVKGNMEAFERLLAHNPKARIVWVHVGMDTTEERSPELTRRLLEKYPNLFLSISGLQHNAKRHWFIKRGQGLNPAWRAVIMAHPDRFMIGSDPFYQPDDAFKKMPKFVPRATRIAQLLPARVARMIAFENAARVYKLSSRR